jgi:TPR repeat protein
VNDTFAMPTSESKSFSSQYLFISDGPHALSRSSVIDREVEALSNRLNELVEGANIPLKPAYSVEIKTDDDIDVLQKIQRRWEGIAVNFPPQFENDDEKAECVADLQRAMHVIATTSTKFSLFRLHGGAAYLAARIFEMGYNLDIPLSYDPQNKTPVAYYFYKAALDHTPSDPELVCDFGVCLAQTRSPKAIQVLERARNLGSVSANWPLGLQYHFAGASFPLTELSQCAFFNFTF